MAMEGGKRLAGGHSASKPKDDEVMEIMKEIKAASEIVALGAVEVVSYTKQIVAGTNYMILLKHAAGTSEVKVFKPLPYTGKPAHVVSITGGKKDGATLAPPVPRAVPVPTSDLPKSDDDVWLHLEFQATNLPNMDVSVSKKAMHPDPYLKIYIGPKKEEIYNGRPNFITDQANPKFVAISLTRNNVLGKLKKGSSLTRKDLNDDLQFHIAIIDADHLSKDDPIGHVTTTLAVIKEKAREHIEDNENGIFDKIVADCEKDLTAVRLQVISCQPLQIVLAETLAAKRAAWLRAAEAMRRAAEADKRASAAETARKNAEAENNKLKAALRQIHLKSDLSTILDTLS